MSRIRIGHGCTIVVHSRNRLSFPGLVFLKVDWTAFGVWYWVIWQDPRCWGSRNNSGWLVSWKTLWNLVYMGYPLSVIRGLVHPLPCSRVAQFVAKLSEHGFLFVRIEWWMMRMIGGRNLEMGAAVLVGGGLVAAEILGGGIVVEAPRGRAVLLHLRLPARLGGNAEGNSRRSRKRRSCWRNMVRSISSRKRRLRRTGAFELQEQAEVGYERTG